jgi:small subunit ribosomal protein S8
MQDPISDMFTRIRNAGQRSHVDVLVPASRHKKAILQVLLEEGYIAGVKEEERENKPHVRVELKYFDGKPVIAKLKRESKPALRRYVGKDDMPRVLGGLGCLIVSTSKGVMTDKKARELGVGGEIIGSVE